MMRVIIDPTNLGPWSAYRSIPGGGVSAMFSLNRCYCRRWAMSTLLAFPIRHSVDFILLGRMLGVGTQDETGQRSMLVKTTIV